MRYKLIAADMDGTLLDSHKNITDRTSAAIHRALRAGVVVVIATGRSIQGVEKYGGVLRLDSPVITYNGAMIITPRDRRILYRKDLEPRAAAEIIRWGKKLAPAVCIWSENRLYTFEIDEKVTRYAASSGVRPAVIGDEDALVRRGVSKILWYDEAQKIERYQRELGKPENVSFCTTEPYYLEFFDGHASKGGALDFLGKYYGIDPSEMIAVGDGMNDLSMIEYAGLGVSMGNAPEGLKERSDFVTLPNDEDGVAHVIDRYLLR